LALFVNLVDASSWHRNRAKAAVALYVDLVGLDARDRAQDVVRHHHRVLPEIP